MTYRSSYSTHLLTTSNFSTFNLTVGSRESFRDFDMFLYLDDSLDVIVVNGSEVKLILPCTGEGSTEYADDILLLSFPANK